MSKHKATYWIVLAQAHQGSETIIYYVHACDIKAAYEMAGSQYGLDFGAIPMSMRAFELPEMPKNENRARIGIIHPRGLSTISAIL